MPVLMLRHCRGEAAVSAPVGVWICKHKSKTGVVKFVLLEVCAVDRWSVAPAINKFYQS